MKKIFTVLVLAAIVFGANIKPVEAQNRTTVVEYVTGTWCPWCPCSHDIIQGILTNYPNTVILAYHGGDNSSDPWWTHSSTIRGAFGFNSYPTGVVGRNTGIIGNTGWNNKVVQQSNMPAQLKISIINKSYNPTTREITLTANVQALANVTGHYKLNFVLTESNLVYPQTGNGTCAGNGSYVHNHVVKGMLNGAMGEDLHTTGTWTTGTIKSKSLTYTLPAGMVPENCDINTFVYLNDGSIATQSTIMDGNHTPVDGPTGIVNNGTVADSYKLSQNYPNPFNPTTNINFSIPKDGNVSLKFYDVLGNEVAVYADGFMKAGTYSADFDGTNLSSGVYFYTLTTNEFVQTKKMLLAK